MVHKSEPLPDISHCHIHIPVHPRTVWTIVHALRGIHPSLRGIRSSLRLFHSLLKQCRACNHIHSTPIHFPCRIDKLFTTVSILRVLSVYRNMKFFFLEFRYRLIAISRLSAGPSRSPVWLKANTLSAGYCRLGLVCNHGRTAATLLACAEVCAELLNARSLTDVFQGVYVPLVVCACDLHSQVLALLLGAECI